MSVNIDEKKVLRDSLTEDEGIHPPSYSVEAPRQEAPKDLCTRLASLDLRSLVKVSSLPSQYCHLNFLGHMDVIAPDDSKRI